MAIAVNREVVDTGTLVFSEEEVLAVARSAREQGEAAFDVVARRCALLVIDMQDEFVGPGWLPP